MRGTTTPGFGAGNLKRGRPSRLSATRTFIVVALAVASASGCTLVSESADGGTTSSAPSTATPITPPTSDAAPAIVDAGPRDMANGAAVAENDGTILYTVAEGDVTTVICERFALSRNQLRFDDGRPGGNCYSSIATGDHLRLEP